MNPAKDRGLVAVTAAVLAAIGVAYSGPGERTALTFYLLLATVIAIAPLLISVLEPAASDASARFGVVFGMAWFGLNPLNADTIRNVNDARTVGAVLGLVLALALYRSLPRWRRFGVYLAPALGAALCHRLALAFCPLLFAGIFLFEDPEWTAIPQAAARSIPALFVSLFALRLPANSLAPILSTMATAGKTFVTLWTPWAPASTVSASERAVAPLVLVFLTLAIFYSARRSEARPLAFGLIWFLVLTFTAPETPLPSAVGLAIAAGWIVARAAAVLPAVEARLGALACFCVLAISGAGVMEQNGRAFLAQPMTPQQMRFILQTTTPPARSQSVNPEALLSLSYSLFQSGKYPESIAAARAALQAQPNFPGAYNNIAAAYAALGQWDAAIEAAQQALRLDPNFALARNNLVWALEQKKLHGP